MARFIRTIQTDTVDDVVRHAFYKLNNGQQSNLTPIEIAALMEDAILSEEDGMLSTDALSGTLATYVLLLSSQIGDR